VYLWKTRQLDAESLGQYLAVDDAELLAVAALGDVPDVASEPVAVAPRHGNPLGGQFGWRNGTSKLVDSQ
jgi:hypothetical protein